MPITDKKLQDFLLDSGLISKKDIAEAGRSKQKLKDYLLKKEIVTQERLSKIYAYLLGIPFVDLSKLTIKPEILRIIPEPIARAKQIIAFKQDTESVEVAMIDPADLPTIESIAKKSGLKILPRITNKASIENGIKQYQKSLEGELQELVVGDIGSLKVVKEKEDAEQDLEKIAKKLPIIKIVDTLLKHAILRNASDIHIEPLEKEVEIRYRIDGLLRPTMVLPKQVLPGAVARIKVLSNLKLDEHRLPQDGRFKIETRDYKISFRVSVLPTLNGEKVVMRLLPENAKGLTLEQLGLRSSALEAVHRAIQKPHGMVLVTGPTGAGKTTTLYTIIDILNKPEINITTIEDPIEYRLPHVNQSQVKPKIGYSFANGLRSIVRQDPDIIMVGEIRDNETAGISINAALTGHLLLSTLHTNDAATTLPRLIDMDIEPFLIASTVHLIIAQRLVRKLCYEHSGKAKKYKLSSKELDELKKNFDLEKIIKTLRDEKIIKIGQTWENLEFIKPQKCPKCQDGYKGRIGIFECLEADDEIRKLITQKANGGEIDSLARKKGMLSLSQDGFIKAVQGVTSLDEILRVSQN